VGIIFEHYLCLSSIDELIEGKMRPDRIASARPIKICQCKINLMENSPDFITVFFEVSADTLLIYKKVIKLKP